MAEQVQDEGITEEQGVERLLSKMRKPEEKPEPEETPEPEVDTSEPEETQDHSEPVQDDDEEEIEADFLGEKVKVRGKEASELVQRFAAKAKELEANTTRKFQEAAEVRKAAEKAAEGAQLIQQLAEKNGELLGHRAAVQARINQLRQINVQQLQATDPAALAGLTAEMQQHQFTLREIETRIVATANGLQHAKAQMDESLKTQGMEEAKKYAATIKNWSPEYDAKLLDYVMKDVGAPVEEVRGKMSGWLMKLIHQAYEGSKVTQAKPWEKRSPQATQTLKPGASGQTKGSAVATVEKVQQRFKKSGSLDDAAALLLARSKLRKR